MAYTSPKECRHPVSSNAVFKDKKGIYLNAFIYILISYLFFYWN